MNKLFILLLLALGLAACNDDKPSPPQISGWTALYSTGISRCDDFDFGELHYCVRQMNAQIGQTIRMTFTISGTGTLHPTDPADIPPATVALFVANDPSGYGTTRWWCPNRINLTPGTVTISCAISSAWTGIYGKPNDPPISNIQYVGYTMGGQYFAGHGVAATGQVHFKLDGYWVQ